jgi:hypothetical protein
MELGRTMERMMRSRKIIHRFLKERIIISLLSVS